MSAPLTDEQVAEGLALAADRRAEADSVVRDLARLALALQERLQAAERALKKNDEDWSVVREVDRQEVVRLQAALQAAEAERDHWKGRWKLDTSGLKGNIARLHEEVRAREAERDEALADRDKNSQQVADEYARAQQARREAFEEAAKLRCYHCRLGSTVRPAPGGPSKLFWHDASGGDVVVCESSSIRALAEGER